MIAHFADLQLGYNYGPNGKSEARRRDVGKCFSAMIWEIIERQPTTVLLVGDIFHFSNPRRAELLQFQWGLMMLSERLSDNATIIVVSGNHDTPKAALDVHPLRLFEHIPKVFCVWEEDMRIETADGDVYAVPWVWGEPLEDLTALPAEIDILAVHAPVLECLPEAARDTQKRFFDPAWGDRFRYVALGDFHSRVTLGPRFNVVFPGSLEHTSFGEAEAVCGGVFVFPQGSPNCDWGQLCWWDSPARPMHLLELDLTGKENPQAIIRKGLFAILGNTEDQPLVRLTIKGADATLVDAGGLAEDYPTVKIKWVDTPAPPVLSSFTPGEVDLTWMKFAEQNSLPKSVRQLGSEALQAVAMKQ